MNTNRTPSFKQALTRRELNTNETSLSLAQTEQSDPTLNDRKGQIFPQARLDSSNAHQYFFKTIRFVSLTLVALLLLTARPADARICVNASSYTRMFGNTMRSDVIRRAHDMAFEAEKMTPLSTFVANNDTDFTMQIRKSVDLGCKVLIGLYTSRECMIAGPLLAGTDVTILSPTCGHPDIIKSYPHVFTGVPSAAHFAKALARDLDSVAAEDLFTFYQPTEVFSKASYSAFNSFRRSGRRIEVDREGHIGDQNLKLLQHAKAPTLYIEVYAAAAVKLLTQLDAAGVLKKDVRIIGSAAWALDVSAFEFVKPMLQKVASVFSQDNFRQEDLLKSSFSTQYKTLFRTPPLGIHLVAYDITRLGVQCYKKAGGEKFSADRFRKCLMARPHTGQSGRYEFHPGSPFADRPVLFTDFRARLVQP